MPLRDRTAQATARALASGALEPIETSSRLLDDDGWPYVVRVVRSLGRKPRALGAPPAADARGATEAQPTAQPNPFLPYDRRLFVADLGATHVALLNKFPVIAHHLLIVTREFEDQSCLLTRADFDALALAMADFGGLGFYNGGVVAGASQRHKHLQLVPLPLEPEGPDVPFEPLLARAAHGPAIARVPDWPFDHGLVWLEDGGHGAGVRDRAEWLHRSYHHALDALGIGSGAASAYNLLCTERWLLVVPREREHFGAISVNALGFVGGLLARDEQELELIERSGVRQLLAAVSRPGQPIRRHSM